MAIEERYLFRFESEETGDGFDDAEDKLSSFVDELEDAAGVFNSLEKNGAEAFTSIADEATKANDKTQSLFQKITGSPFSAFGRGAVTAIQSAGSALDFVTGTFERLQGSITTSEGRLSALNRGFSELDISQVELANQNFSDLNAVSTTTLSNIQQQVAVGVAPTLGALASLVNLNAQSFAGLSDTVDSFARRAALGITATIDNFSRFDSIEGLGEGLNLDRLAIARGTRATLEFFNFDSLAENADRRVKQLEETLGGAADNSDGLTGALRSAYEEQDRRAKENAESMEQLRKNIEDATSSLSGLSLEGNKAADAVDRVFASSARRIGGLGIEGLGDLDLSGAQRAREGLADLEASELARIFGLNLSESKKQELAAELRAQISSIDLQLQFRSVAAIDEAQARSEIQDIAAIYQAQIGRDDAVQIPVALEKIKAGKAKEEADELKESLGFLSQGLTNTAAAFADFGRATTEEGERAFKDYQRIQVAFSTAAAISAAVQSGGFAAGAGPAAAFAAYTAVAGAFLGAVAQLESINTSGGGSASASLSGGGRTGPIGGSQEAARFGGQDGGGGGDQYNFTFIGDDSDTITLKTMKNFARFLKSNDRTRRSFQSILNS